MEAITSCGAYIWTDLPYHNLHHKNPTCVTAFAHSSERKSSHKFLVNSDYFDRPYSPKIRHFIRPAISYQRLVSSGASYHKAPENCSRRTGYGATLSGYRGSATQGLRAGVPGANHTRSASVRVQTRAEVSGDGRMPLTAGVEKFTIKGVSETVVGVLGGGQLGRMLCQAASPLDIKVAILDPQADAPAAPIAFRHVVGSFKDKNSVREFAKGCVYRRQSLPNLFSPLGGSSLTCRSSVGENL